MLREWNKHRTTMQKVRFYIRLSSGVMKDKRRHDNCLMCPCEYLKNKVKIQKVTSRNCLFCRTRNMPREETRQGNEMGTNPVGFT